MIKNRREVASAWAEDETASYADIGRRYNIDRRTVWSIVRAFYRPDKIKELMANKRENRRNVICNHCGKKFLVKYPCVAKVRLLCDSCYKTRVFFKYD